MKPTLYMPETIYNFDDSKVALQYPKATYCGEFALSQYDNKPIRWYKQSKPNRKIGHKTYFGLYANASIQGGVTWFIIGRDLKQLNKENDHFRQGILCLTCNTYTYSRFRHDYHSCKCERVSIDGGPAYIKTSWKKNATFLMVKIDLLKGTIVDDKCSNRNLDNSNSTNALKSTAVLSSRRISSRETK